jgi:hypothetical protein
LGAAAALLDQPVFWRHQAEGLAVFVGPGAFRALRLPLAFAELVTVSERFHVKPLLPYFGADGDFFVMALSQNRIRLLEGPAHSIDEVELSEVPASLADALHHDDPERELLYHVVGGTAADRVCLPERGGSIGGADQFFGDARFVATVTCGAGLTHYPVGAGVQVLEVNRHHAHLKHRRGKSDTIDA